MMPIPGIVGFWHFKFILGPNTIDAGTQQWHSDGIEVINSGARSPITGSVCLGVWKKVGERHYKLRQLLQRHLQHHCLRSGRQRAWPGGHRQGHRHPHQRRGYQPRQSLLNGPSITRRLHSGATSLREGVSGYRDHGDGAPSPRCGPEGGCHLRPPPLTSRGLVHV
jgi:hypothetical protein